MNDNGVKNRNFDSLFKHPVQFEIPFFQRGYAWEKKNWDQLFDDIKEQILEDMESTEDFNEHDYFFGPIVVLERTNADPEIKKFLVIDGQQRITTIYLLLAAIRKQLHSKTELSENAADHFAELSKYIINDVDIGNEDYRQIKVFSTKGDRLPTFLSIFDSNPNSPLLAADQQLYIASQNKIDKFNKYLHKKLSNDYPDVPSLWKLSQAILFALKIVWIPLDDTKDDPQAIFESLNDKGMPLSAGELLCNYMFKPIMDGKQDHEQLHTDYWLSTRKLLENEQHFEDYLRALFSIGQKKMIGKGRRVYVYFKNNHKKLTEEVSVKYLRDIKVGANFYKQITSPIANPHKNSKIKSSLSAIQDTRMESSVPYILSLLLALNDNLIEEEIVGKLLKQLLVLLVRRKMKELPTTKYDVFFPALGSKVIGMENPIQKFHDEVKNEGLWISDDDFRDGLINNALYRKRDLAFSRLILREIDKSMQVYGQLPDYSTLHTIEHVLPQNLTDEWRSYLGDDVLNDKFTIVINTLGNLCFLSQSANSHAGQDPFTSKVTDYTDVTALTKDLKQRVDKNIHWNTKAINDRSEELATKAIEIWSWTII
ncbi:hypothetical protein TSL6_02240 [Sulfurovum sp. TSL6]|uniref:DUF262 domain-containing protein n=1 Tax=Sulfurovum sp. TSL6 TaxID=2826995 RepID=UPI001CC36574|nr:DUF262 domain-containing protein [Sulfurovum sp. TSL6]GIT99717.1 hypothetical protein TSL6_02240 [Sulfurovum sp. TSL6]